MQRDPALDILRAGLFLAAFVAWAELATRAIRKAPTYSLGLLIAFLLAAIMPLFYALLALVTG